MCSFGSCQTRFEFLSQFRKVRNAFECFVTQVQTRLPKTKCVWPMKINVICTVLKTTSHNPEVADVQHEAGRMFTSMGRTATRTGGWLDMKNTSDTDSVAELEYI